MTTKIDKEQWLVRRKELRSSVQLQGEPLSATVIKSRRYESQDNS